MKPIVGINGDVKSDPEPSIRVKLNYVEAVRRAGGIPVVLPACDPRDAEALLARVDAVVLTGGGDIDTRPRERLHPSVELMDARRQAFDMELVRGLLARPKPALGICLGMQEMAYAAGARLLQHLPDAGLTESLDHRAAHDVELDGGSRLAEILGARRARVVSHHHQGVADVPKRFKVVATAPDGVVEAFEDPQAPFFVGVQWHPERDLDAPETARLFAALVEAARGVKVAR
jgi:putative glutamine amidotransferase